MSPYLKALGGFLALLATNVATQVQTSGFAWPTTIGDGIRWFVTIVAGTWLIYQLPYKSARTTTARKPRKAAKRTVKRAPSNDA